MKVIRITTNAASLKVFEATCIKQHDCKKALECGTFELVLPVKQDMTAVTENLENEPFIGNQDTRVTDDEDVEDQEIQRGMVVTRDTEVKQPGQSKTGVTIKEQQLMLTIFLKAYTKNYQLQQKKQSSSIQKNYHLVLYDSGEEE